MSTFSVTDKNSIIQYVNGVLDEARDVVGTERDAKAFERNRQDYYTSYYTPVGETRLTPWHDLSRYNFCFIGNTFNFGSASRPDERLNEEKSASRSDRNKPDNNTALMFVVSAAITVVAAIALGYALNRWVPAYEQWSRTREVKKELKAAEAKGLILGQKIKGNFEKLVTIQNKISRQILVKKSLYVITALGAVAGGAVLAVSSAAVIPALVPIGKIILVASLAFGAFSWVFSVSDASIKRQYAEITDREIVEKKDYGSYATINFLGMLCFVQSTSVKTYVIKGLANTLLEDLQKLEDLGRSHYLQQLQPTNPPAYAPQEPSAPPPPYNPDAEPPKYAPPTTSIYPKLVPADFLSIKRTQPKPSAPPPPEAT